MSIVLVKQQPYTKSDNKELNNETVCAAFKTSGITSILCPPGITVELLPAVIDMPRVAVIHLHKNTKQIREDAKKLKSELEKNDIKTVILPFNATIEVLVI